MFEKSSKLYRGKNDFLLFVKMQFKCNIPDLECVRLVSEKINRACPVYFSVARPALEDKNLIFNLFALADAYSFILFSFRHSIESSGLEFSKAKQIYPV